MIARTSAKRQKDLAFFFCISSCILLLVYGHHESSGVVTVFFSFLFFFFSCFVLLLRQPASLSPKPVRSLFHGLVLRSPPVLHYHYHYHHHYYLYLVLEDLQISAIWQVNTSTTPYSSTATVLCHCVYRSPILGLRSNAKSGR